MRNKKAEISFSNAILIACLLLTWLLIFGMVCYNLIDLIDNDLTQTKKVKCIDKHSNEFEDEWCKEEIRCGVLSKKFNKEYCYG